MTFKEYSNDYLHSHGYKKATIKAKRLLLNHYIYPMIGDKDLPNIDKKDMEQALSNQEFGGKESRFYQLRRYLTDLFDQALSSSLIKSNPMAGIYDFDSLYYERIIIKERQVVEIKKDSPFPLVAFSYLINQHYSKVTFDLYLGFLKYYILPWLRLKRLNQISPEDILRVGEYTYCIGLNETWPERIIKLVKAIFDDMVDKGIITYTPFSQINLPIKPRTSITLNDEQKRDIRNVFSKYGFDQSKRKEALNKIFFILKGETFPICQGVSFQEVADKWLSKLESKTLRKQTYHSYCKTVNFPLITCFKDAGINDIKEEDLKYLLDAVALLGDSSFKNIIYCIKGIFNYAKEKGMIKEDISLNINRKTKRKIYKDILNDDDVDKFLTCLEGEEYGYLYGLTLMLGLRVGEIRGLLIDKIDFDNQSVLIDQQLNNSNVLSPTKNGRTRRLKIPDDGVKYIYQALGFRRKHKIRKSNKFLFVNDEGKPLSPTSIDRYLMRIVSKINRPDITTHCLRHTNATIAARMNDSVPTIQNNIGHTLGSFVTSRYIHMSKDNRKDSALLKQEYIERLLFNYDECRNNNIRA